MDNALEVAERTYVNVNIHDKANEDKLEQLDQLPDSCAASADCLERQREFYEQEGVFSKAMVDSVINQLRAFDDRRLRQQLTGDDEAMQRLVNRYFHCG